MLKIGPRAFIFYMICTLVFNYVTAIFSWNLVQSPLIQDVLNWLLGFDRVHIRFDTLQHVDGVSGLHYLFVLLGSVTLGIPFGVAHVYLYIRTTVLPGKCIPYERRAIVGYLGMMMVAFWFFWVSFLDKVDFSPERHVSMAKIFLWPIFPGIGTAGMFAVAIAIFMTVGGLVKFFSLRWGRQAQG